MFNGLLHVLLEPGTDAQDGHAVAAGQLHGRCARELVLGVDEAEAACIGHVLIPQVLHGPAACDIPSAERKEAPVGSSEIHSAAN